MSEFGPANGQWIDHVVTTSDSNYDMDDQTEMILCATGRRKPNYEKSRLVLVTGGSRGYGKNR